MAAGIDTRHSKKCRSRDGGRCNCEPTYQAHVYDSRAGKRIRKSFPTYAAARGWRQDAVVALRNGATFEARPIAKTLREEAGEGHRGGGGAGGRRRGPDCDPQRPALQAERDPVVRTGSEAPRAPSPRTLATSRGH